MGAMLRCRVVDELVMDFQQSQHAGLIGPHLAAKAYNVGEHDSGEAAGLELPVAVLWHEGDYRASGVRLSNSSGILPQTYSEQGRALAPHLIQQCPVGATLLYQKVTVSLAFANSRKIFYGLWTRKGSAGERRCSLGSFQGWGSGITGNVAKGCCLGPSQQSRC